MPTVKPELVEARRTLARKGINKVRGWAYEWEEEHMHGNMSTTSGVYVKTHEQDHRTMK